MHKELLAASTNEAYSPAIRAALKLGLGLLNKYNITHLPTTPSYTGSLWVHLPFLFTNQLC